MPSHNANSLLVDAVKEVETDPLADLENFGTTDTTIDDRNSWLYSRNYDNPAISNQLPIFNFAGQGIPPLEEFDKDPIQQFSTSIPTKNPEEYLPLVYGNLKLSGNVIFIGTSGATNEFLDVVVTLSEGFNEAVDDVYIDDVISTDVKFTGLLNIRTYLGTSPQTADALLVSSYPNWTANHRLDGIAYAAVRLKYNRDVFKNPPNLAFTMRGKHVYDPRTTLTSYSDNPVLCMLDYLTNNVYGAGFNLSQFDLTNIGDLATTAETQINTGTGNRNLFKIGGKIDTKRNVTDNIRILLSTFRGTLLDNSTLITFSSQLDSASIFSFDESNVVGKISVTGTSVKNFYNAAVVDFLDTTTWKKDTAQINNASYLAEDNNVKSEFKAKLALSPGRDYALDVARFVLDSSRNGVRLNVSSNASALVCVPNSVVTVTLPTFGYVARLFRVLEIVLNGDLSVGLSLVEHDPGIYISGAHFQKYTVPTPSLPDPFFVPIITGFGIATGDGVNSLDPNMIEIGAARLTWDASPNVFVTNYEVQYKLTTDATWIDATTTVDNDYVLSPLTLGSFVDFRVRAVNINKSVSAYVTQLNVEITQLTPQGLIDIGFEIQDVTGLKIWDDPTGNAVIFEGKDAKIEWRHTQSNIFELGQEPEGGDSGSPDNAVKWYRVDTINTATGLVVRSTKVTDNWFFYKLEMNVEDNTTPIRALQFRVYQEDRYNRVSATPAFISISNPQTQSSELTALLLTPSFDKITVKVNTPKTTDYAGLRIHMSTTPSFTPDASNLIGEFVDNRVTNTVRHVVTDLTSAITYYFRIAGYDEFSDAGLDFTAEISTTTIQLPSDSISGLGPWATRISPADLAFITANLAADSVPSTRIVNLVVAKLLAGVIQSTQLIEFTHIASGYGTRIGLETGSGTNFGDDSGTQYQMRFGNFTTKDFTFFITTAGSVGIAGNFYAGASQVFGQSGMQALANGDFHVGDGVNVDLTVDISMNSISVHGAKFTINSTTFGGAGVQLFPSGAVHFGDGAGVDLTFDILGGTMALKGAKFTITSETFGAAGIQLFPNGDVHFGDGAGKDLTFDANGLIVGRDVQSPGFDAFNNTSIYYHKLPGQNDGVFTTGGATKSVTGIQFNMTTGTPKMTASIQIFNAIDTPTWTGKRRWDTLAKIDTSTATEFPFFIGQGNPATDFIGFEVRPTSAVIRCVIYDTGVAVYDVASLVSVSTTATSFKFKVESNLVSGNTAFTIDSTLEATDTTGKVNSLVSDTVNIFRMELDTNATSNNLVDWNELKFTFEA